MATSQLTDRKRTVRAGMRIWVVDLHPDPTSEIKKDPDLSDLKKHLDQIQPSLCFFYSKVIEIETWILHYVNKQYMLKEKFNFWAILSLDHHTKTTGSGSATLGFISLFVEHLHIIGPGLSYLENPNYKKNIATFLTPFFICNLEVTWYLRGNNHLDTYILTPKYIVAPNTYLRLNT